MTSFRWTAAFALLIAALVALTMYDFRRANRIEEEKQKELTILRLKESEITKIELINKGTSTTLEKKEDAWHITAPIEDTADNQEVMSLLASLESEKVQHVVAEGDDVDLGVYGLSEPLNRLRVSDSEGNTQEIQIGSVKAYDSSLYARIGDEKKVLLVGSSWDIHLSKPVRELRNKRLFRGDADLAVEKIEIRQKAKGYPDTIVLSHADEKWKMGGTDLPVSTQAVEAFIDQVKALRGADVFDESKTKATLSKHDLVNPAVTIRFTEKGKGEPGFALLVAHGKKEGPNVAATSSDVKSIFAVYKSAAESLRKKPDNFFDKSAPFQFNLADVSRVQLELPALKAEIVKTGDNWELEDKGLQKDVDSAVLKGLLEKLGRLEAVRFVRPIEKAPEAKLKNESRISLKSVDGKTVFEFVWGEKVVEKSDENRPEAQYILARTSRLNHVVGVPEGALNDLGVESVLKPKSSAEGAQEAQAAADNGNEKK